MELMTVPLVLMFAGGGIAHAALILINEVFLDNDEPPEWMQKNEQFLLWSGIVVALLVFAEIYYVAIIEATQQTSMIKEISYESII